MQSSRAFFGAPAPPAWLVGSTLNPHGFSGFCEAKFEQIGTGEGHRQPLLFVSIDQKAYLRPPCAKSSGWRPILTKIVEAAPIRSFGAPGRLKSPGTVGDARRGGWEGPSQISPLLVAFSARLAFTSRTRTTHRPTSHGPLPLLFVSDRRRPYGLRYPTLRWPDRRDTGQPRAVECHFSWFWAVFSARRAAFAAAFAP